MIKKTDLVFYEVAGAAWPGLISNAWLQDIIARYFARKVERKYRRWMRAREILAMIDAINRN